MPFAREAGEFGEILDPQTGAPASTRMTVSVMAPSAAVSDALSTTLLTISREEGEKLLRSYDDVSAVWISPDGQLNGSYQESRLRLSN
jgi:thiamine biosynthesis lipoprotein